MTLLQRTYEGRQYTYELQEGVIRGDYYKDCLVENLPDIMRRLLATRRKVAILDMATGHGYTAVILADFYREVIEKIVAEDINPDAVALAHRNAEHNHCGDVVDVRIGSLYDALRPKETFDLIVSALPPVPISSEEMATLPDAVRIHHWIPSTAGPTGRDLLDGMIAGARSHLREKGIIVTAQADFQNATRHTLDCLRDHGFAGERLPISHRKKLCETTLTTLRRMHIERLGYRFVPDEQGDDCFVVETYAGHVPEGNCDWKSPFVAGAESS